jgi:CRP-like cAMP-binding protein
MLDPSLIARMPLFAGMETRALEDILAGAAARRYSAETVIFHAEAPAKSFYLLLDGHLRVVLVNAAGEQVIVRHMVAGELFGIAPVIGRTTYPATAIAVTDCVVLAWPTSRWAVMAQAHPVFAKNTYAALGSRLLETQDRMVEIATGHVEQRIAQAVLRLARQSGRRTEDGVEVEFPLSRQDIAEMTGTTLHTVSRTLSAWEHAGHVKCGRRKVTVRDEAALEAVAGGARRRGA